MLGIVYNKHYSLKSVGIKFLPFLTQTLQMIYKHEDLKKHK